MGAHWTYIAAAYGVAAVVIAGLVIHAVVDWRRQRVALDALEARGAPRRPR
jgi:heme exporter protein CcmD